MQVAATSGIVFALRDFKKYSKGSHELLQQEFWLFCVPKGGGAKLKWGGRSARLEAHAAKTAQRRPTQNQKKSYNGGQQRFGISLADAINHLRVEGAYPNLSTLRSAMRCTRTRGSTGARLCGILNRRLVSTTGEGHQRCQHKNRETAV